MAEYIFEKTTDDFVDAVLDVFEEKEVWDSLFWDHYIDEERCQYTEWEMCFLLERYRYIEGMTTPAILTIVEEERCLSYLPYSYPDLSTVTVQIKEGEGDWLAAHLYEKAGWLPIQGESEVATITSRLRREKWEELDMSLPKREPMWMGWRK